MSSSIAAPPAPVRLEPAFVATDLPGRLSRELGPDWCCLADVVVRAFGEEGRIDLVALHPTRGVALMGFVEEGEEASPDEAAEALRAMLEDAGFAQRFPGHLAITAFAAPPVVCSHLAEAVKGAFAAAAPTTATDWFDWVAARLGEPAPSLLLTATIDLGPPPGTPAAERSWPALVGPQRGDEEPAPADATAALAVPEDRPPGSPSAGQERRGAWALSLALAFIALAAVLTVMWLFSRGRLPV